MRIRALTLICGLAAFGIAAQDAIKLERVYKMSEADSYKMDLVIQTGSGEAAITMDLRQTIKKVYDNGDADIESKTTNLKLKLNGQELPNDAIGGGEDIPATVQRYDKFARPVSIKGNEPVKGLMNQFNFMRYGVMLTGQELKVGESVPIQHEDKDAKTSINGTAKLVSIAAGIATIESAIKVKNPETGNKPIDLKMTTQVEVANAKPIKVSGTATDVPSQNGMGIESIKFSMTKN